MSSKSKLIIGIVILALGAGLIPTGLLVNDYLRDEVYDGVPEAMTKIKKQALPPLMSELPTLATPQILKGAFDEAVAQVQMKVEAVATPQVLLGIQSQLNADLPGLLYAVTVANGIAAAYGYLAAIYGVFNGTNIWFNDTTWVDPNTGWPGLANQTGVGNFTYTARSNLLFNGLYSDVFPGWAPWGIYIEAYTPGLIADLVMGSGVSEYLNTYGQSYWVLMNWALWDLLDIMMTGYNATFAQLTAVNDYINDMMTGPYVPGLFSSVYGIPIGQAIANGFYMQWANGTLVPTGIDLGGYKGLEAGVPTPTGITLAQCEALWNSSNLLSFTNDSGILVWLGAILGDSAALSALDAFGLTPTQLTMVISWLYDFMTKITPKFFLASEGKTTNRIATEGIFEQWGNGTIFGVAEVPDGFLGEINSSWAGAPYFELGLPTASGLSPEVVESLWDPLLDKTFIYSDSYKNLWIPAMGGNEAAIAELMDIHMLSAGELTEILTWLGAFIGADASIGRSAQLLAYNLGKPLADIVELAFYEQWANGTINGEVNLPEGFLSRRSPPIPGPPYFEIGLMYSPYLTVAQTLALWDTESEYSLLTVSGTHKWFKADKDKPEQEVYINLATENGGLDPIQMSAIIEYLPVFRDKIVNKLAEDDRNLPMEPYELGETLVLSLGIGGGVMAGLGVILLILSRRS